MWKKIIAVFLIIMTHAYSLSIYRVSCYHPVTLQHAGDAFCNNNETVGHCCNQVMYKAYQLSYHPNMHYTVQPSSPESASSPTKLFNVPESKLRIPPRSPSPIKASSSGSLSSLNSPSSSSSSSSMVRVSCIARSDVLQEPVVLSVIRCAEGDQEHYQKECEKACLIKAIKL